ncbi:MAG: type III pantothenate kinase [Burkholderiales bacterium]
MILAIDAGNTRVKWGCHEQGKWLETGVVAHSDVTQLAAKWRSFPSPDWIMISNVAGEGMQRSLAQLLGEFSAQPIWVKPERERAGVKNSYDDPRRLGSDRWCALIAAGQVQPGPVLVANAGTALTVDALTAKGEFIGGLIVPGLRLMLQSLTTGTAHAHASHGEFNVFPTNTLDAIYSGAMQAALGSIERMATALAAREKHPVSCIMSGGAANLLLPHLSVPVREVKHLVLQGLIVLAEQTM